MASPAPRNRWLLVEAYGEIRTGLRLFLDRRYRPSWSARIIPVLAVALMLLSWWWTWLFLSSFWIVGSLLDKMVDLGLAFVIYKVVGREIVRYRQALLQQATPAITAPHQPQTSAFS